MAQNNNNNAQILMLAGLAFVLYKFGDGIANIFGGGSKATAVKDKLNQRNLQNRSQDPWSGEYILSRLKTKSNKKYFLLTGAAKQRMIKEIMNTGGFWRIKPETGNGLLEMFQTIGHKTQVSDLANEFKKKTGKDLLTFIKSKLQTVGWLSQEKRNENFSELLDFVNRLPE